MLAKLEFAFKKDEDFNFNMGSIFQGLIMERINSEYAERLHGQGVKPYSQYCISRKESFNWTLATINKEAKEQLLNTFLDNDKDEFYLSYKDLSLKIIEKKFSSKSYEQLMEETYFSVCRPYINISFDTPTAFKANGKYQFFPTVQHLFYSLIQKYDTFSGETPIYSEKLMEDINRYVEITRYDLKSTRFHLEGVKIPAFRGNISMRIHGPQLFTNLLHMLVSFGEYSGVGIKSAMGMGAITKLD